jgi:hypothetical protein
MPRFDLRQNDGTIDPLASFKVLAVMCDPHNRVQREKMLGNIQLDTGVGQPRRRPATSEAFTEEIRRADRRAAIAGALLLTMLQLHSNGYRPSLNLAILLVSALVPEWKQPEGLYWSKTCHFEQWPHSKDSILRAYSQFRTVAHLCSIVSSGAGRTFDQDRSRRFQGSLHTPRAYWICLPLCPRLVAIDDSQLVVPKRGPSQSRRHSRRSNSSPYP